MFIEHNQFSRRPLSTLGRGKWSGLVQAAAMAAGMAEAASTLVLPRVWDAS